MRRGKSQTIMGIIGVVIGIILITVIFVMKHNKSKGEKIYLNTVVTKDKYNITFDRSYETIDGKAYYAINFTITNNLDEVQSFTFKDVYFINSKGKTVNCGKINDNGFTIASHKDDYFYFACPIYSNSDTPKKLHFSLNGYKFNLYTKVLEENQ